MLYNQCKESAWHISINPDSLHFQLFFLKYVYCEISSHFKEVCQMWMEVKANSDASVILHKDAPSRALIIFHILPICTAHLPYTIHQVPVSSTNLGGTKIYSGLWYSSIKCNLGAYSDLLIGYLSFIARARLVNLGLPSSWYDSNHQAKVTSIYCDYIVVGVWQQSTISNMHSDSPVHPFNQEKMFVITLTLYTTLAILHCLLHNANRY